jgi:hypothetical protein
MAADRMRDEAERLVAAAIAAVAFAARGFGAAPRPGTGFATGSAECCVCPVCRAIAALREPSPEVADRLASGVGELAAGVTAVLRALSRAGGQGPGRPGPFDRAGDESVEPTDTAGGTELWESLRRKAADAARAAAARATSTLDTLGASRESTVDEDPWRAATGTQPSTSARPGAPKKAVAKKAVAKKAVAKKAVAKKAVSPGGGGRKRATSDGAAGTVTAPEGGAR